jgi:hypothetical protein
MKKEKIAVEGKKGTKAGSVIISRAALPAPRHHFCPSAQRPVALDGHGTGTEVLGGILQR